MSDHQQTGQWCGIYHCQFALLDLERIVFAQPEEELSVGTLHTVL